MRIFALYGGLEFFFYDGGMIKFYISRLVITAGIVLLLAPASLHAETRAQELAWRLIDPRATLKIFDRYVDKYEDEQNASIARAVAREPNSDRKSALEGRLEAQLKLKLDVLNELRDDVPKTYAQIFVEKFSADEMQLILDARESREEHNRYLHSPTFIKAITFGFGFDKMGLDRMLTKFQNRIHQKAFTDAMLQQKQPS